MLFDKIIRNKEKFLENKNFSFTVTFQLTDVFFKFCILALLVYLNQDFVVEYTYFFSLVVIMTAIIDFGSSRNNIKNFKDTEKFFINFNCVVVAILVFVLIKVFLNIKYYNNSFLFLCVLLSLLSAIKNTFLRYYEFINRNEQFYKIQIIVSFISFVFIILILVFFEKLSFCYITTVFANLFLVIFYLYKERGKVLFSSNLVVFFKGFPFMVNSISSMAFSQFNIVILNQFSTPMLISNFVIAQRFIDLSTVLSNAYISSEIGKFFKNMMSIFVIKKRALLLWVLTFFCLIPIIIIFTSIKENYDLVLLMFTFLLPIGLVKSITPSYSIVMDYTEYFYYRTIVVVLILGLNFLFSSMIYRYMNSVYSFIIFIDFLAVLLLLFYLVSFKKLNIYDSYRC